MDKQKEILDAALKLFVESGFHGTPTSKIAKEAGVANGTLFHYYKTKDELIIALYLDVKKRMSHCIETNVVIESSFKETFRSLFVQSVNWSLENKLEFGFIQQFYSSPYQAMISEEVMMEHKKQHIALMQEAIDAGIIQDLPVQYIFLLVSSHLLGIYQYITTSDFSKEEEEKVIADSYGLIWKMLT